jgi:NAD(P)-dependent dehydrogenase (short-subunit alcohol dehydrogenase family)
MWIQALTQHGEDVLLRTEDSVALVTGAASGLGRATAELLLRRGASVVLADRSADAGATAVRELGGRTAFAVCDVTKSEDIKAALDVAAELGPLRVVVHCAGGGTPVRILAADGSPASLDEFRAITELNLIATFDILRQAAARMAANQPDGEDRGVLVLTSSIAAFEGQSAQVAYAAAKAGIVGMTLAAARDLSRFGIRVCTIVPGMFDTGMMTGLSDDTREVMAASVPHPPRLGRPGEYAQLAVHIVENSMLNGECIRLDGALRLSGADTAWGNQLRQENHSGR